MALGALRHGPVASRDGLHGDPEWGDQALHQERMGCDDACISGARGGCLGGVETLGDALGIVHVMLAEAGVEGGTAGELDRREGRLATQDVTEERGIFRLQSVQPLRDSVLEGTRQAVGHPDCVTDHAPAMVDERCEGAHRGARGAGAVAAWRDGCAAMRAGGRCPSERLWRGWA